VSHVSQSVVHVDATGDTSGNINVVVGLYAAVNHVDQPNAQNVVTGDTRDTSNTVVSENANVSHVNQLNVRNDAIGDTRNVSDMDVSDTASANHVNQLNVHVFATGVIRDTLNMGVSGNVNANHATQHHAHPDVNMARLRDIDTTAVLYADAENVDQPPVQNHATGVTRGNMTDTDAEKVVYANHAHTKLALVNAAMDENEPSNTTAK